MIRSVICSIILIISYPALAHMSHLFAFESDPEHYLFLRPYEHSYQVLEHYSGQTTELKIVGKNISYDGAQIQMWFAGGQRLIISSDKSFVGFSDRAREPLNRIEINQTILNKLGVGFSFNPITAALPPPAPPQKKPVRIPDHFIPLFVHSKTPDLKVLADQILALNPEQCQQLSFSLKHVLLLMCAPDAVDAIKDFSHKSGNRLELISENSIYPAMASIQEALSALEIDNSTLSGRQTAIRYLLNHQEEWLDLDNKNFSSTIFGLGYALHNMMALSKSFAHHGHVSLAEKFRSDFAQTLESLAPIDRPEVARLILHLAGELNGAGLHLMQPPLLRQYLDWNSVRIVDHAETPFLTPPQLLSSEGWHILKVTETLPRIGVKLKTIDVLQLTPERIKTYFVEPHTLQAWAFLVLGMPNEDNNLLKKEIVTFIIMADQLVHSQAEKNVQLEPFGSFYNAANSKPDLLVYMQLFWETGELTTEQLDDIRQRSPFLANYSDSSIKEYLTLALKGSGALTFDYTIHGSSSLMRFIHKLASPSPLFKKQAGYSEKLYFANVADILSELLEDSRYVLNTTGTYEMILDAAIRVSELTQNPHLSKVVQSKLTQVFPLMQQYYPAACEALLSPLPEEHLDF